MGAKTTVDLILNGEPRSFVTDPGELLADVLRREGFLGVKKGCGEGTCGACVVLIDGAARNSCITFVAQVHGREVTTIEGLGTQASPHPLMTAFVEKGAVQCGFCTPGMILAAKALLDQVAEPTSAQIREALDGNLCRCTGYVKEIEAVHEAARAIREGTE